MSAAITAAVTAIVGTAYSVYSGETAKVEAKRKGRKGRRLAQEQKSLAEQEFNRTNQRKANTSKLRSKAAAANSSGVGSTLLTGSSGAGSGQLGSTSLLGG